MKHLKNIKLHDGGGYFVPQRLEPRCMSDLDTRFRRYSNVFFRRRTSVSSRRYFGSAGQSMPAGLESPLPCKGRRILRESGHHPLLLSVHRTLQQNVPAETSTLDLL